MNVFASLGCCKEKAKRRGTMNKRAWGGIDFLVLFIIISIIIFNVIIIAASFF